MKKTVLYTILLLSVSTFFSACSADVSDAIQVNTEDTLMTTGSIESSDPSSEIDPPYTLLFWSMDEYFALMDSVELEDAAFYEFIDEKSYSMNGIREKEDVLQLKSQMDAVSIPSYEELTFSQMVIYPERGECTIRYTYGEEAVYKFSTTLDPNVAVNVNASDKTYESVPCTSVDALYYYNSDSSETSDVLIYHADVDGYSVVIRAFNTTRDAVEELLNGTEFNSISVYE